MTAETTLPTDVRHLLQGARIVPVAVIDDPGRAPGLGEALLAGGLDVIEVTLRTPAAVEAIAALAGVPGMRTGAGTVVTADQVDAAVDAGATFVVSPGLSADVVRRCRERGVPVLPGVATPSDLMAAVALGLTEVKFFPAGVLGGPAALKALSAPFPGMTFVPTGGVSAANLADYLRLPCVAAVGGSWMVGRDVVAAGRWQEITDLTAQAVRLAEEVAA